MRPPALHSYLLWRSSVEPDTGKLATWRYTAAASLIPAMMVGLVVFGWYAGLLVALSLVGALGTDVLCRWRFSKGTGGPGDATWLITGLLIGLLLPPCAPWWVPIVGSSVAMAIGRYWLSVDGMPLVQPAALGVLLLHVCLFPVMHPSAKVPVDGDQAMNVPAWPTLAWPFVFPTTEEAQVAEGQSAVDPVRSSVVGQFLRLNVTRAIYRQQYLDSLFAGKQPMYNEASGIRADAVFGPRPIDLAFNQPGRPIYETANGPHYEWLDALLYVPGTIGGSSGLALLFGICLLVFTRAVSMLTPLLALFVLFAGLTISGNANVMIHLLNGSTLLGFFYLASDPTCAPRSRRGRSLAGIALGLLEWVLRFFMVEATFVTSILTQGFSFVLDQYIAPPREESKSSHARMSITSLGRL